MSGRPFHRTKAIQDCISGYLAANHMDSAPRSKKARTKSSSRKSGTKSAPARADEVLLDSEETVATAPKNARYAESSSLAIHSGVELGQDEVMDDVLAAREAEGTLDVNLAELSLGQRLAAIAGENRVMDEVASSREQKTQSVPNCCSCTFVNANPHTSTTFIRFASVGNLSKPFRRLVNTQYGPPTTASAMSAITSCWQGWQGLHATLTSRLALQDSLLSLNGKLDMVLSQIEMRSSSAPAPLKSKKDGDSLLDRARQPTRYVEGESEDEDADAEEMAAEPLIESDGEEGSIEDIELGGESSEGDDPEEGVEYSEDEEGSDSGSSAPALNGFIDDEAEEFDDDEDEDDESD
ncbi:hypothetical protein EDD16DRAFT_1723443 [Pisolithus croceorrhizus]|nr:hypothetical protein EDD16DRAFT_1723443 [Pisolithus croceorrhizus]